MHHAKNMSLLYTFSYPNSNKNKIFLRTSQILGIWCLFYLFSSISYAADYLSDATIAIEQGKDSTAVIHLKNHLKQNPDDIDGRIMLGKVYIKQGKLKSAEKEYAFAHQLDAENKKVSLSYAGILQRLKMNSKAEKILVTLHFSDNVDESKRLVMLGDISFFNKQYADAKKQYFQSLELHSTLAARLQLVKIDLVYRKLSTAEASLNEILSESPDEKNALYLKAQLANTKKNHLDALTLYDRLLELHKNNPAFLLERAQTKILMLDYAGAEVDIKPVLKDRPKSPEANFLLAQIKYHQHDYEIAIRAAERARDGNVGSGVLLILGMSHIALGNYHSADKYLIQYLAIHPGNVMVQNMLANTYIALGKSEQAILMLSTIDKETLAKNGHYMMTLGTAYIFNGELKKGMTLLNQAKEKLTTTKTGVEERISAALFRQGDLENALKLMQELSKTDSNNPNIDYLLIITHIQSQQIDKAKEALSKALSKWPDSPMFYHLKAVIASQEGDKVAMKTAYQRALELDNKYIPAYMGLAEFAVEQERFVESKQYLNRILSIDEKYVLAYVKLASIANKLNRKDKIETILKKGLHQVEGDLNSELFIASSLSRWYVITKNNKELLFLSQDLNSRYPDNSVILSLLATALIKNNQPLEAKPYLKQLIINVPNNATHRLLLAKIKYDNNEPESSILSLLDEALKIDPSNHFVVLMKIGIFLKLNKYTEAEALADQLDKNLPGSAAGSTTIAVFYLGQKKNKAALKWFKKAYPQNKKLQTLSSIIDLLLKNNQLNDAINLLNHEISQAHFVYELNEKLAYIYLSNDDNSNALKAFKAMLAIKQDEAIIVNNVAWLLSQENKLDEAINYAQKAYKLMPESWMIMDTYGVILLSNGHIEKGLALLQKAVDKNPGSLDIQFHLAQAYAKNNQAEQALTLMNNIFSSGKVFAEKKQARTFLEQLEQN